MECPQGISDEGRDDCITLNNCIYGLVQAARQYYKNAVKILKKSWFVGGNVGPCLYVKKIKKGIVYIALYVDNNLMIGVIEAIDEAITVLKENGLELKVVEGLQDYLSCDVKFSMEKRGHG